MRPRTVLRSFAGAVALGLITMSIGPSRVTTPAQRRPIEPSGAALGHTPLRGILVALHRAQRTGDLALSDGSLIPLRFASLAQARRLHVGDHLLVSTHAHGHARLLVRSWRRLASGSHWNGSHWNGSHWNGSHWNGSHWNGSHWNIRLQGVVARRLHGNTVEVLGVNGAAVLVHLSSAPVTLAPRAAPSSAGVAYADTPPAVAPGEAVDGYVRLTGLGSLVATMVQITALHVPAMAIEGSIVAVNGTAGTMTIRDENGLTTTVTMPASVAAYRPGQHCEVTGTLSAHASDDSEMHAQNAELEITATQGQGAATPTATAVAAPNGPSGVATPTATAAITSQVTATITPTATTTITVVATIITPQAALVTTALPQATATGTPTPTTQDGHGSSTTTGPVAVASTPTPIPTLTPIPAATPTAVATAEPAKPILCLLFGHLCLPFGHHDWSQDSQHGR